MLPHRDSKLTRIGLIVFFIVIVLYGLYEAQGLLFGPKINVSTETITVREPYVKIEGRADRIVALSMNGKQIPVTEEGEFNEPYLLAKGQNRIALEARDTYGRKTSRFVEIFYAEGQGSESASTTTPGATEY
jgi:hypothetical protein